MKKPSISAKFPPTSQDWRNVRESIEIIEGRRGEQCDLDGLESMTVSNPPTQAEVDFIRRQILILAKRLEE